jgi:hypothetical protein
MINRQADNSCLCWLVYISAVVIFRKRARTDMLPQITTMRCNSNSYSDAEMLWIVPIHLSLHHSFWYSLPWYSQNDRLNYKVDSQLPSIDISTSFPQNYSVSMWLCAHFRLSWWWLQHYQPPRIIHHFLLLLLLLFLIVDPDYSLHSRYVPPFLLQRSFSLSWWAISISHRLSLNNATAALA